MTQKPNRRRFLTGVGVTGIAGVAGCVGQFEELTDNGADPEQTGNGTSGESPPEDSQSEPEQDDDDDDDDGGPLHSGDTIPTYPYAETSTEPLNPHPDLEIENPVLTADDVDDLDARFVSDPFLFAEDDEWHMFFAVVDDDRGRIAHATSDEGLSWEYDRIVLNLRHHVTHPLVFKWEGNYYMTVQGAPSSRPITLYRANSFPHDWYGVSRLYDPSENDHGITDHALFRWDDRWWDIGGDERQHTYLYYSDELESSGWQPHDENPVVEERPSASRPGGRPIVRDNDVLMFFQSQVGGFGTEVNAYRITELSTSTYEDERHPASPLLQGTDALDDEGEPEWNASRMHHYDSWYLGDGEGWRAAVDGDDGSDNWKIGIYRVRG